MTTSVTTHPITHQHIRPSLHWLLPAALLGAGGISAIALFDAATHGITGEYSAFAEGGEGWPPVVGSLVHGLGYLVLTACLILRAEEIDSGSRAVRWFRRLTAVAMGILGTLFLVGTVVPNLMDGEASGMVGSTAFLAMFLFGTALGISLLATGRRTPATWALIGILAAFCLMVVLGFVAPTWLHPAYPETAVHFGVALLALPQPRRRDRAAR